MLFSLWEKEAYNPYYINELFRCGKNLQRYSLAPPKVHLLRWPINEETNILHYWTRFFLSVFLLDRRKAWDIDPWRLWRQFWIAGVTGVAVKLTLQNIWNESLLLIVFIGPEPGVLLDSVDFVNVWTSVMVKWDEAPKWNCSHRFSIYHFIPYFILVYYMAKWER